MFAISLIVTGATHQANNCLRAVQAAIALHWGGIRRQETNSTPPQNATTTGGSPRSHRHLLSTGALPPEAARQRSNGTGLHARNHTLDKLAEMADKIMEVAMPQIASVKTNVTPTTNATPTAGATPNLPSNTAIADLTSKVENLQADITRLVRKLNHSSRLVVLPVVIVLLHPIVLLRPTHPQPTHSAGIIIHLVIRPNVAANPALGRQTTRPATSGDPGRRPTPPRSSLFRT